MKIDMSEVYDKIVSENPGILTTGWQSDAFVLRTPATEAIVNELPTGSVGRHEDTKGRSWYILYNGYTPWYQEVRRIVATSNCPMLELSMRYREEAFADGSYYAVVEKV